MPAKLLFNYHPSAACKCKNNELPSLFLSCTCECDLCVLFDNVPLPTQMQAYELQGSVKLTHF